MLSEGPGICGEADYGCQSGRVNDYLYYQSQSILYCYYAIVMLTVGDVDCDLRLPSLLYIHHHFHTSQPSDTHLQTMCNVTYPTSLTSNVQKHTKSD